MKDIVSTAKTSDNNLREGISLSHTVQESVDESRYNQFLETACQQNGVKQVVVSFPFTATDSLQWMASHQNKCSFNFYCEKPSKTHAIAALGKNIACNAAGEDRFQKMTQAVERVKSETLHFNAGALEPDNGYHFVGGFSFWDNLDSKNWTHFEPASLILPEYALIQKGNRSSLSVAVSLSNKDTVEQLHQKVNQKIKAISSDGYEPQNGVEQQPYTPAQNGIPFSIDGEYKRWIKSVADIKQKISDQKLKKVVLGRQLQLPIHSTPNAFETLRRLRARYPNCSSFLVRKNSSETFVGCSPELLLSVNDNSIHTEALAGSIASGNSSKEDVKLQNELLESKKNRAEHAFVVKAIKELIAPLVDEIHHSDEPEIKKLANVQHLHTPISGTLKESTPILSLLKQLHPTPAMGGTPRRKALQCIRQHEEFNRGCFAGPVGWIDSDGSGEFTVAIRSGLIKEEFALLFAGCGIVGDSDPKEEWQETNLKFMPMLSALNYD